MKMLDSTFHFTVNGPTSATELTKHSFNLRDRRIGSIKIEAVVRPERVNVVVEALLDAGCGGYHVSNVTGKGTQQGVEVFTGRGATTTTRAALPKTVITTVVKASMKDAVIEAILDASKTGEEGQIGDGKIFISPISEVIRVRTGEKDDAAL
jgi:nitrogen regulatory protein PII